MKTPTAAVLIPKIIIDNKEHILFEKRAEHLTVQPGDVCFPGGGIEPGETAEEAVIRECSEELLIKKETVTNVSEYKAVPGPKGTRLVQIFTGEIIDYSFTYSGDEVAAVFAVPIDWFLNNAPDSSVYYPTYEYDEFVIWGFTARVLKEFLEEKYNVH